MITLSFLKKDRKILMKEPTYSPKSSRASGSVTLNDVAKLAGVSPITVSRALNYPDKVAQKTLNKVQEAIAKTGYVPNLLAGGLASKKSRLIAVIVPSMSNTVYAETVRYLTQALRQVGYQVFLGESWFDEMEEEQLVSAILSRKPDGIMLTGVNHSANCRRMLASSKIPIVETWDLTPNPMDIVIGFSHQRIGESIANYALEQGYRSYAVVTATDQRAERRLKAFRETMEKQGVANGYIHKLTPPSTFKSGRDGLRDLIEQGFKEGLVLCSSDTIAQGVLAEAQAQNIKVPEQMGIFGFGDQPYAAHTFPSLSTVKLDRALIGKHAVESLLARIEGKAIKNPVIDVGYEIMERESTAKTP